MWLFPRKYTHEVFLSHAIEDRDVIATELYDRLDEAGAKIWYSANSIKAGSDLEGEIEKAIENSRFGVVVLTRVSVTRPWPLTEYNWLRKKEMRGRKVVLPVAHEIEFEEVPWPGIDKKYGIHSSRGMDLVVERILEEINDYRKSLKRFWWLLSSMTFILLLVVSAIIYQQINDRPTDEQIKSTIDNRIQKLINTIGNKYVAPFKLQSSIATLNKIDSARVAFESFKSYYRNEYEYNNDVSVVRGRKNVEAALSLNLVDLANSPGYGMDSVDIYWISPTIAEGFRHSSFSLANKRSLTYSIKKKKHASTYSVKVNYTNNIQYINVSHTTPPLSTGTKRHEMTLLGLPPSETYYFEKSPDGEWHVVKVE